MLMRDTGKHILDSARARAAAACLLALRRPRRCSAGRLGGIKSCSTWPTWAPCWRARGGNAGTPWSARTTLGTPPAQLQPCVTPPPAVAVRSWGGQHPPQRKEGACWSRACLLSFEGYMIKQKHKNGPIPSHMASQKLWIDSLEKLFNSLQLGSVDNVWNLPKWHVFFNLMAS